MATQDFNVDSNNVNVNVTSLNNSGTAENLHVMLLIVII